MNEQDKKFEKLIDDLKDLPKVEAKKDFEDQFWRKLNSPENEVKQSFIHKLFMPIKLIPAATAVAAAVIVFYVIKLSPAEPEDPFMIQPRMREDLIILPDTESQLFEELKKQETEVEEKDRAEKQKTSTSEKPELLKETSGMERQKKDMSPEGKMESSLPMVQNQADANKSGISDELASVESTENEMNQVTAGAPAPVSQETQISVPKVGLNFRQINLSPIEKQQVEMLKQRNQLQDSVKTGKK